MCIIFIAVNAHPSFPLLLSSNRDEYLDRDTTRAAPSNFSSPFAFGGKDTLGGGTWLGVSSSNGRFAAVLNVTPEEARPPAGAPSRGNLPLEWLAAPPGTSPAMFLRGVLAGEEGPTRRYAGFSLIVADMGGSCQGSGGSSTTRTPRVFFGTNAAGQTHGRVWVQSLSAPGLYAVSNDARVVSAPRPYEHDGHEGYDRGDVGKAGILPLDGWPKCRRGIELLRSGLLEGKEESKVVGFLMNRLLSHTTGNDSLTDLGGVKTGAFLSPRGGYGTRTSTAVLYRSDGTVRFTDYDVAASSEQHWEVFPSVVPMPPPGTSSGRGSDGRSSSSSSTTTSTTTTTTTTTTCGSGSGGERGDRKIIFFVRHGESTSNLAIAKAIAAARPARLPSSSPPEHEHPTQGEWTEETSRIAYGAMRDPAHFDAPLTHRGVAQARSLAIALASRVQAKAKARCGGGAETEAVELVVASTLSRAVQTAHCAFPRYTGRPRPMIVMDELREFAGPMPSENRRRTSEMVREEKGGGWGDVCVGGGEDE